MPLALQKSGLPVVKLTPMDVIAGEVPLNAPGVDYYSYSLASLLGSTASSTELLSLGSLGVVAVIVVIGAGRVTFDTIGNET